MNKNFILLFFLLSSTLLLAEESDLDSLLNTYAIESELSKKTKLENSGNRIIFTRRDLERMQARNLKDILKSYPLLPYKESRYAFPDLQYAGGSLPFSSGSVRIFIDEQELTNALYGSGFEYLGDIDLNFIDHVEIYGLTPTFEYSTEPTTLLIKLYSKVAQRDMGGKFQASRGTMGYNAQSIYYTDELENFSYLVYASRLEDIRAKYRNTFQTNAPEISRDQERYHIFTKIYNKKHSFQFQAIKNNKDMFIGMSQFATPTDSNNDDIIFHTGYNNKVIENLNFSISYDQGTSKQVYSDQHYLFQNNAQRIDYFDVTMLSRVLTTQLKYRYNFNNNNLVIGTKHRYKNFNFQSTNMRIKNTPLVFNTSPPDYSLQQIGSFFIEEGYNFAENSLLTFGAQYSHVENNADIASQDLYFARLGYTYTTEHWVFNTTMYSQQLPVEPYMYNPLFNQNAVTEIRPQLMRGTMLEIKFKKNMHELRLFGFANYIDDMIGQNDLGTIDNFQTQVFSAASYIDYTLHLNRDNKIIMNANYGMLDNLPSATLKLAKNYGAYIRMLNTYEDADFFSELIYNRDNITEKNFYDLSLGLKYQFTINLALSVKGENILGEAQKSPFFANNPLDESNQGSFYAAPIEQRFIMTVDYLF